MGKTKLMTYVKKKIQIDAGARIVQLLLFPYMKGKAIFIERAGAFGSPVKSVCQYTVVNDQRPKLYNHTNE